MTRFATALALLASAALSHGQSPANPAKPATSDKANAYYNFAMGHLYAELAGAYGNRSEYLNKAIDYYRQALKLDPEASFLFEELTDLYIQGGRLKDAVTEAEELLRQKPDNLDARRILGRIYTRMIGDTQQGKINENMLRQAIEQYQKITEKAPKDLDSWLALGRLYHVANNSVDSEKAYKQAMEVDPNNEEALTGLAIVYSDIGDTRKAIEMLRVVTERNPGSRTLAMLANSYEQIRDYKSAVEVLKRAIKLQPENPHLRRALAQDLLLSDRYDEALEIYQRIAEEEPKNAQAQLRISEIYRQKRDFDKARQALAKAKSLDSDSLEIRYDEVNLLDAEGKTEQAIATLKGILDETAKKSYSTADRANRTMFLERLGMLYRGAAQYQAAVDSFRQIAQLNPETAARVSVQVVDTYRLARDLKRAKDEADAAVQKYPNERLVKLAHASLLADMGNSEEAAAELRTLLGKGDKENEKNREIQLAIAQVYEKGKRFAEMEKALDEAERLSDSDQDKANVHFMRGAMYEKMKRYEASEAAFRKVLEIDPNNAGALNYLGYMFADRNVNLDEAQKLIARALELDPQNGAYLDSLGWVYYRQNKLPEAENMLVQALARIGKDPTIHDHLGDVYARQGKTKEAINQWQISLKEWESTPPSELDPAEVAKVTRKLESARVRLAKETGAEKR